MKISLHFDRSTSVLNATATVVNTSPSNYAMKLLTTLAISVGLLTASQAMDRPSFHTKGTPTGSPLAA
jgi:hypothetical protein